MKPDHCRMLRIGIAAAICCAFVATSGSDLVVAQGVTLLDTVYTPPGYEDGPLMATIFMPDPSTANRAGFVLGHGLTDVRLGRIKPWCDTLAAHGFVAMTIDYPELTSVYPKPVRAFKIAVEFLRRNAARFGLDPIDTRVFGLGKSQGSVIWGETIIWDNDDTYFGTDSTIDDRLNGAILFYGAYDFYHNVNPQFDPLLTSYFLPDPSLRATKGQCITNWANITTPLLLFHGTLDATISVEQSRALRDSLLSRPGLCALVEYNAGHSFDVGSSNSLTYLGLQAKDKTLAWLDSLIAITDVKQGPRIPTQFCLNQNYPNPFNPSTTIEFLIPVGGRTSLRVYDLLGREVATLIDETLEPGVKSVHFAPTDLSSGVYFYRMEVGTFVATRKMILMR